MASGRDLAGHRLLSCEAICYNGAAYNTSWGANSVSPTAQNQALFTINSIFAAGVNRLMIHGFPYAQAPDVTWPGFAAFSPYYNNAIGFGEAWGPRTPQWEHVPGIAAYIARTQLVLQTGTPTYDVAFWRHKLGLDGHRSAVDHEQRHQARVVALVHQRLVAGVRRGAGARRTTRT